MDESASCSRHSEDLSRISSLMMLARKRVSGSSAAAGFEVIVAKMEGGKSREGGECKDEISARTEGRRKKGQNLSNRQQRKKRN